MRILLQTSTYGYKTYHSFAKRIREKFPETIFGVPGVAPAAEEFIKNQTEIEYEIFDMNCGNLCEDEIDFDGLRKFEESLPNKSLWQIVATDRKLGRAYLYGIEGYEYGQQSNRLHILNEFSKQLKMHEQIFNVFKPDIFIPAIAMGGVQVTIYKQLCDKYDVEYALPDSLRVQNYCSFTNTPQVLFPIIDKTYQRLITDRDSIDLDPAKKLYDEMVSEFEITSYFDAVNERMKKKEYFVAGTIRKIFILIGQVSKRFFSGGWNKGYTYLTHRILLFLQKIILTSRQFGTVLNPSQKYLYYPLHVNPEYSTLIQGTMFGNQLIVIEALAKSIPVDWVVYVKEHPAMVNEVVRSRHFYERLKQLPNVVLAPVYADANTLINNAEVVVVINGTSGWEAILRSKPVITMSDYMFNVLGLSRKCTDIEKLSTKIYEEVNKNNQITHSERKRRIMYYLTAVAKCGFWISYPNQFFYLQQGTDEEYEVCGRELADGFVQYLDYLQKEKGCSFGIHQET